MPLIPRSISRKKDGQLIAGNFPSICQVIPSRKSEAIANRRKAAEKGSISLATTRPAIKVPPQKMAVKISLKRITSQFTGSQGKYKRQLFLDNLKKSVKMIRIGDQEIAERIDRSGFYYWSLRSGKHTAGLF